MEVTNRTFQGRYLLLPCEKLRAIVLGALGRAQRMHEMSIHAFTFASNHFHLLLSPRDAAQLAAFMELFESKVAREVNRLYDWSGSVWGDRYSAIPIEDDEEAVVSRLRYVLAHGVKEDLVAKAAEWPGAHCVRALTAGEHLLGTWYDRSAQYHASRGGREVDEDNFAEPEEVVLTALPCWCHLSDAECRSAVRSMVQAIEDEAAARHLAARTRPAGVAAILHHHPHERPKDLAHSPRPWFHTRTREGWDRLREAYRLFEEAFRHAARLLRDGISDPPFPEGSFPPGLPFVPHQAPG